MPHVLWYLKLVGQSNLSNDLIYKFQMKFLVFNPRVYVFYPTPGGWDLFAA